MNINFFCFPLPASGLKSLDPNQYFKNNLKKQMPLEAPGWKSLQI